jgi:hypothetical protein
MTMGVDATGRDEHLHPKYSPKVNTTSPVCRSWPTSTRCRTIYDQGLLEISTA